MPIIPDICGAPDETQIADPGPGLLFSIIPPANERWRLVSVSWFLTTNATVLNRRMWFYQSKSFAGAVPTVIISNVAQAASLDWSYAWTIGADHTTSLVEAPGAVPLQTRNIPYDFYITRNQDLIFQCVNIQPGDSITGITVMHHTWLTP